MPSLKQLNCKIQWAETNTPFQEYGTVYGDGVVETFIVVPENSQTFNVHLTSTAFISEGLAMVVFIDGNYQCNRNRVDLKPPEKSNSRNQTEIDFTIRQKEKPISDGTYLGREWRFDNHNIVSDIPHGIKEGHFDLLGTIEVLVLRCQSRVLLKRTLSTSSSGADSVINQTSESKESTKDGKAPFGQDQKPHSKSNDNPTFEADDLFGGLFANVDGSNDDLDPQMDGAKFGPRGHWTWIWQPQESETTRNYDATTFQNPPSLLRPDQAPRYSAVPSVGNDNTRPSFGEYHKKFVHFDRGPPQTYSPVQSNNDDQSNSYPPKESYQRDYTDYADPGSRGQSWEGQPPLHCHQVHPSAHTRPQSFGHYAYDADARRYSDFPQHIPRYVQHQPPPPGFPIQPHYPTVPPGNTSRGQFIPYPNHRMVNQEKPVRGTFIPAVIPAYPPPYPFTPPAFQQGPGYFIHNPSSLGPSPQTSGNPFNVANNPTTSATDPAKDGWTATGNTNQDTAWATDTDAFKFGDNAKPTDQNSWNAADNQAAEEAPKNDWEQNNANSNANDGWDMPSGNDTNGKDWSTANQNNSFPQINQTGTSFDQNQNNKTFDNSGFGNNEWGNSWKDDNVNDQVRGPSNAHARPLYGPFGEYYTLKTSNTDTISADAEEEPRYDIPQSVAIAKGSTKQVQPGKGYVYCKKRCCPIYIDTFEAPYARFVFKYRTKEQLKREINVDLDVEASGNKEVQDLQNMEKTELIKLLLLAKGALGGKMPELPPKLDKAELEVVEATPVDPPTQTFLKYTLPPLRNAGITGDINQESNWNNTENRGTANDNSNWANNGNDTWNANNNQTARWDGVAEKDETKIQPFAENSSGQEGKSGDPSQTHENIESNPFISSSGTDAAGTFDASLTFAKPEPQQSTNDFPRPSSPSPDAPSGGQSTW